MLSLIPLTFYVAARSPVGWMCLAVVAFKLGLQMVVAWWLG
jgi:hypothetical protein